MYKVYYRGSMLCLFHIHYLELFDKNGFYYYIKLTENVY